MNYAYKLWILQSKKKKYIFFFGIYSNSFFWKKTNKILQIKKYFLIQNEMPYVILQYEQFENRHQISSSQNQGGGEFFFPPDPPSNCPYGGEVSRYPFHPRKENKFPYKKKTDYENKILQKWHFWHLYNTESYIYITKWQTLACGGGVVSLHLPPAHKLHPLTVFFHKYHIMR